MTNTPRLGLPAIEAAQAQKHVTHNEALVLHDALTQLAVENRSLTTPPGSPPEGACYIPAQGATGAWSGWSGQVALFSGGGWLRIVPASGLKAWVRAERLTITYEDGIWRDGIALTVLVEESRCEPRKRSSPYRALLSKRVTPLSSPTAQSRWACRRVRRSR